MPSPLQMPKYSMNKVQESIEGRTSRVLTSTTLSKVLQSPRIPPSGTPVKSEPSSRIHFFNTSVKKELDSPSSHTSRDLSDLEDICRNEEYVQIAFLKSHFIEFTHIFPSFPKTHIDGFTYVIELSPEILNEQALLSLRDALQYSLTGGGGPKLYENVKFFGSESQKVPMKIHSRQCAGATQLFKLSNLM